MTLRGQSRSGFKVAQRSKSFSDQSCLVIRSELFSEQSRSSVSDAQVSKWLSDQSRSSVSDAQESKWFSDQSRSGVSDAQGQGRSGVKVAQR